MTRDTSRLRRVRQPMPTEVRKRLIAHGLIEAYRTRPAYQRNDYLAWIGRAKLEATRERRISQMLDELELGDRYMKMRYRGRRK